MERERQVVGSTTSLINNDLIGSKKSSSSSSPSPPPPPPPNGSDSPTGGFGSIFAPYKVLGRECSRPDMAGRRRQNFANEGWNSIPAAPGNNGQIRDGESVRRAYESIDSIFKEDKSHPCHLSSSIFYGGQDNYSTTQSSSETCDSSSSMNLNQYKKDEADPDDGSASRGNWWQGSLYY